MLLRETTNEFNVGKYRFFPAELKLEAENETILLTQREKELLEFLCQNPGRILRREEVLVNVWGKNDFFLGRSMDVFITRIRKHLNNDPSVSIETIHGIGYRFLNS